MIAGTAILSGFGNFCESFLCCITLSHNLPWRQEFNQIVFDEPDFQEKFKTSHPSLFSCRERQCAQVAEQPDNCWFLRMGLERNACRYPLCQLEAGGVR